MKAGYVKRFSPVERLLHWVNALGFFFLLVTGLILYLPSLSELVSRRQTVQGLHFWAGVGWLGVLAAVVLLGGRRLLATAREVERFDSDDLRRVVGFELYGSAAAIIPLCEECWGPLAHHNGGKPCKPGTWAK